MTDQLPPPNLDRPVVGSYPTYDPDTLIEPSQKEVDELYADPEWAPLTNRATASNVAKLLKA